MSRADHSAESRAHNSLMALQSAWAAERRAAEAEVAEGRLQQSLAARITGGMALRDLSVEEESPAPGDRIALWVRTGKPLELRGFRGGPGDPVRLWRQSPQEPERVHGVLWRRRGESLSIAVRADQAEALLEPGFRLDIDAPTATFDRGDKALRALAAGEPGPEWKALRRILLAGNAPESAEQTPASWLDGGLNDSQRRAVALALGSPHIALVHGPPGTGKTRTLVEIVRQWVALEMRVLATGASNAAVDNLAGRIAEGGIRVVRLGHPARVDPAVEPYTLEALSERSTELQLAREWIAEANALRSKIEKKVGRGAITRAERREQLRDVFRLLGEARRYLERVQKALISGAEVVCATAAGADVSQLSGLRFDAVALDEATQSVDPVSLVALMRAPRAVLAGDPRQLPPTVLSSPNGRGPLCETLFERVARAHPPAVAMLTEQYRMSELLMRFPSKQSYDGKLVCSPEVASRALEELGIPADPLRPGGLIFIDTAGTGWQEERTEDDPSTSNPGHARRVAAEVRRLLGRGVAPGDMAVIAPYHAQVLLLREFLAEACVLGLEVGSVDGFQGREKEVIILDLVRSNDSGEIGFLRDTRRMNVAITRSRSLLLVVGDSATVGEHAYFANFLREVEQRGTYLSAWSDEAPAW